MAPDSDRTGDEPGSSGPDADVEGRPRVLVLSQNYPSVPFPTRGLWVRRFVRLSLDIAVPEVVAPVPYAPPFLPSDTARRWRRVPRRSDDDGVVVHHPRFPTAPGHLLHALDARMAYLPVRRVTDRLQREAGFDLIHAHFIFPEGVIAARLGGRYDVPVVTTEHSLWEPWLDERPRVRDQVEEALPRLASVSVVSEAVARTVAPLAAGRVPVDLLRNVVDESTFRPPADEAGRDPHRLLFVGAVRRVKGLDVLVEALSRLAAGRKSLRLDVIGEPFFRAYRRDQEEVQALITRLGLEDRVRFLGAMTPEEVAGAMRRCAAVVVPGRRESFSAVAVEALACGTPVVATRCGGPEEILTAGTGVLVPIEDPVALARGIEEVVYGPRRFRPSTLRRRALALSGPPVVRQQLARVYGRALSNAQLP